jgi:hypothetical protein
VTSTGESAAVREATRSGMPTTSTRAMEHGHFDEDACENKRQGVRAPVRTRYPAITTALIRRFARIGTDAGVPRADRAIVWS